MISARNKEGLFSTTIDGKWGDEEIIFKFFKSDLVENKGRKFEEGYVFQVESQPDRPMILEKVNKRKININQLNPTYLQLHEKFENRIIGETSFSHILVSKKFGTRIDTISVPKVE